jgi:hypothetical protein
MKITPLIYVDEIETTLSFWVEGLGFESIAEVAEDGEKLFVLLKNGEQELMIETRKLVGKEFPALLEFTQPSAALYIDVENLGPLMSCLNRVETRVPVHKTSYGTSEIIVREPGGNLVCFAAHQ